MFKWMDRVYVNARKKIFKNLDTGEILNLEVQDDPSNIVTESETPLTAHCLNMAQQELVDDMSKDYTGTNITADTVAGYSRIKKVYGKTTEEGTGDKSPDNPYKLKCVGDDVNLFDKNNINSGYTLSGTDGALSLDVKANTSDYIAVESNTNYIVSGYSNTLFYNVIAYYDKNKNFISVHPVTVTATTRTFKTSEQTKYIRFNFQTNQTDVIKLQKDSVATAWSPYGYGTVENISTNGTNSSSNIVYVDKSLYSMGDVRDELDYVNKKITRRCRYAYLKGADNENWQVDGTNHFYTGAQFTDAKPQSSVICNILECKSSTGAVEESCLMSGSLRFNLWTTKIEHTVEAIKNYLKENPITLVYPLATPITEDIECSDKIVQYADSTNVYNRDGAEIEVSLTNNKAISEINENIDNVEQDIEKYKESIKSLQTYSTEEQIVGTWFGKPLYRRGFTGITISSDNYQHLTSSNDIKSIIDSKGFIGVEGGVFFEIGKSTNYNSSTISNSTSRVIVVNKNLRLDFGNDHKASPFEVVVEYTKTTD